MARAYLRANAELLFEGVPYIIERQCSDGVWVLRHRNTERPIERTTEQLFDAHAKGTLTFQNNSLRGITNPRRSGLKVPKQVSPVTSAKDIEGAKIRLAYVRAIVGLPCSQGIVEAAIDEVWNKLVPQPAKKPGWISVYRWAKAYLESNESTISLIASNPEKGNRESRYAREVVDICTDVIDSVYLSLERPTIEHVVNMAKAYAREANARLPKSCQFRMPTRRLIQRLINDISSYDRDAARFGREAARKKYRGALKNRLTNFPLQRAEIDHTRMDLFVIDDLYGLPLGRPWLTLIIEDFTRCILGFCLSFEPPSRATVARCLRFAFMPKTKLREEYPDLKNDWTAFGVVSELVLDGGVEFHSHELENICFELNIEQHFAPRKTPWFKGKIERVQGTLNRGVAINTPGKTFSSIFERDDYDPKEHAVVTNSGLRHLVVRWIVDIYHQKTHSSIGCSPAQMWAKSVRVEDVPLMDDPLRFDTIVAGAERRLLSHKGIEFSSLQYNSPEMTDLRRQFGERFDVDVRVDRSNLGSVIVLHPERGTPYRVPCLRPDYAEGLTEWQHKVCKRYSREQHHAEGDVDAWLDSLLEISDIVQKEMKIGKRTGTSRERVARWSEGKQEIHVSSADQVIEQTAVTSEPRKVIPAKEVVIAPISSQPPPPPEVVKVTRRRFTPVFEERQGTYSADGSVIQESKKDE